MGTERGPRRETPSRAAFVLENRARGGLPLPLEGKAIGRPRAEAEGPRLFWKGSPGEPYSNMGGVCNKAREGKRLRGPHLFWKTEPEVGRDCFGKEAPESHGPRQTAAFAYARKAPADRGPRRKGRVYFGKGTPGRPRAETKGLRLLWKGKAPGRPRTGAKGPRLFWKEDPRGAVFQ